MPASRRSTPAASPICPECASGRAVAIVYGYPGLDLMRAAERGAVELGGCLVAGDDPRWRCQDCGARFA